MNQLNDKGYRHGYWNNGKVLLMNRYNDKLERYGYWEKYYNNGNLWYKGHFINNKVTGYWEIYKTDGSLRLKEFYL